MITGFHGVPIPLWHAASIFSATTRILPTSLVVGFFVVSLLSFYIIDHKWAKYVSATVWSYGAAQRQCRKRTQLFCDLRVRIKCNECILSMRTSLDFRKL